jgi:two-component system response regulator GlrR
MEDLPLLVEHLLHRAAPSRRREDLLEPVWNAFRTYHWPGNVRELAHAIQGLLVAPDCVLQGARRKLPSESGVQRLEPPQVTIQPLRVARRQATDGFERHYLSRLLKHSQGNVTRAAEQAEVSRQMIQKLMRKHDVGWR